MNYHEISKFLTLVVFLATATNPATALAACPRPSDFSNRQEAEKYDKCISKEGYSKPKTDARKLEKTSCLSDKQNFIECRKKELRGESIKAAEVKVYGASPTPSQKFNPLSGEIPVEEETEKKKDSLEKKPTQAPPGSAPAPQDETPVE